MRSANTKAIIFIHLGFPSRDKKTHKLIVFNANLEEELTNRVLSYYKKLLLCKNIGLVYVYVDTGTQMLLENLNLIFGLQEAEDQRELSLDRQRGMFFTLDELAFEQKTRDVLRLAVDSALGALKRSNPAFDVAESPAFQFIGLPHLLSLFSHLLKIDPSLVRKLAGQRSPQSQDVSEYLFTYDSPKFVEAIIRLARGAHATHAQHPIFRIDADVEVNEESISNLIEAATATMESPRQFHFFSGGYGNTDETPDPLNDYAVRTHFLPNVIQAGQLTSEGYNFLRDLGEFGATQLPNQLGKNVSATMSQFISTQRQNTSVNRDSEQVISGAGLYISRHAIRLLPPFMNFYYLTTWIDDHLKRRLHEALGHIPKRAVEHIANAKFKQRREEPEEKWTREYFGRLLRGCLVHSLIVSADENKGQLSQKVEEIVTTHQAVISDQERSALQSAFKAAIVQVAHEILLIWQRADYIYNCPLLKQWAEEIIGDISISPNGNYNLSRDSKAEKLVDSVVDDALAYLDLLTQWDKYVAAIDQLEPAGSYWLYRTV